MRLAILATALSISLFSVPAHAQSVGYAFGPDGPWVFSFDSQLTDQDIKNFESDFAFCDKLRFDAGVPYVNPAAEGFVQGCMQVRLAANSHEPIPKWHENAMQAAELCEAYASKQLALEESDYRAYSRIVSQNQCLVDELDHKH